MNKVVDDLNKIMKDMVDKKMPWSRGMLLRDAILKAAWVAQVIEGRNVLRERRIAEKTNKNSYT